MSANLSCVTFKARQFVRWLRGTGFDRKRPTDLCQGYGRAEVIAYLRWLADQPDGVTHRAWLFHAGHIIARDADTVYLPETPPTEMERHGDQTI